MTRAARILEGLLRAYGPQEWWPGDGPFEMIVGAVLTQNTAWRNAQLALDALSRADALSSPEALAALRGKRLTALIRSAGFPNQKARTLLDLCAGIARCPGGLEELLRLPAGELRARLLGIRGIGDETADAILVYAARRPVFVADAYARRLAARHTLLSGPPRYAEVQAFFEAGLPPDAGLLGELHALVVKVGKEHCRTSPRCAGCPLAWDLLPDAQ